MNPFQCFDVVDSYKKALETQKASEKEHDWSRQRKRGCFFLIFSKVGTRWGFFNQCDARLGRKLSLLSAKCFCFMTFKGSIGKGVWTQDRRCQLPISRLCKPALDLAHFSLQWYLRLAVVPNLTFKLDRNSVQSQHIIPLIEALFRSCRVLFTEKHLLGAM